ncbi:O-antigen ligase family protein [Phenylobacterium sp.]|jgi:hypothetical protein|uniref:O-antigen ligase family protein n=1 Tax=Phenylobacterium sp. TaxID=1871053 RepID=UPI002F428068
MSIQFRTAAARPIALAWRKLWPLLVLAFDWTLERFPIVGRASARRRTRVVLAPYKRMYSLRKSILKVSSVPLVVFGCLLYGFFFGLTAPYLLVPFAVPIVILAATIIWALPEQRTAPTLAVEYLFTVHFAIVALWPRYLAITLPGMPWITLLRLFGLPMAALFLVSLSTNRAFRKRIHESASSLRPVWLCFCGFVFVQIITSVVSTSPVASIQAVFDQQIYWTCIFLISCTLFRKPGTVERYWALLCSVFVVLCVIGAVESRVHHVLWASHIPKILKVPDPSVQVTLTPEFRPGTNVYRAKAVFSTPLAFAEYISLLTPFWLHFGFSPIRPFLRGVCFAMIPITFIVVRMTDARLGLVGMLVCLLLYGALWTIVRWRSNARDLLAAAAVYAYPVLFMAGVGAILSSHRAKMMLLGGGAQAGSTEARNSQLGMAMSKIWTHPWGFGSGQSGNAMGFAKGDFITIDNYFITLLLDYGLAGVILWYGMFIAGIATSVRYCVSREYGQRPEAKLLAPLAVCLTAFLIVKWVHGQSDNHSIFFMFLGMICALVYRLRHDPAPEVAKPAPKRRRADGRASNRPQEAYTS